MRNLILMTTTTFLAPLAAQAQTCPNNATTCSITTQSMGDSATTATGTNTKSDVAQVGNSTGSVASGVNINPSQDLKGQISQSTDGNTLDNRATGNLSTNDNKSQASNGNQSMGQANTGTSSASTGASTSHGGAGGSASNGAITLGGASNGNMTQGAQTQGSFSGSTGASTSSTGAIQNTNATGPSTSGVSGSGNSASGVAVGDVGSRSGATSTSGGNTLQGGAQSNGSESKSGAYSGGNSVKGGDQAQRQTNSQSNGSASKSGASTAGNINLDTSDKSTHTTTYKSRVQILPPILPAMTAGVTPGALGEVTVTQCMPRMAVVQTQIIGSHRGIIGKSKVEQGFTYDIVPFVGAPFHIEPWANGEGYDMYGHQAIIRHAIIGVSGGGNVSLGGGSGGGSFGQAGLGSSSNHTRLVTNIQLVPCQIQRAQYVVDGPIPRTEGNDAVDTGNVLVNRG